MQQKTELSPPTHQTHNTDTNSSTQTGNNTSGGNNSQNSASSGATSVSISASNASSSSAAVTLSTSNAPHKYTLSSSSLTASDVNKSGGATNLSTNNVISSATNAHKSTAASHSNSNNSSSGGNANAQSYAKEQHHRDDRYTTQAQANSGANNASNVANAASANAPSLYVSVPLSTANVPGINIPTNSASGGATGECPHVKLNLIISPKCTNSYANITLFFRSPCTTFAINARCGGSYKSAAAAAGRWYSGN